MKCGLYILEGPEKGQGFVLPPGKSSAALGGAGTLVGRSTRAQVRLTDPTVSVEHALVSRQEDACFIENLSAHGTLVNEVKISGRTRLRHHDRITLSPQTVLRFDSPDAVGILGRPEVLAVVGALILIVLVLAVWRPWTPTAPAAHWNQAYDMLQNWTLDQARKRKLPSEAPQLMADGWRLQRGGDPRGAKERWWRLSLMLEDPQGQRQRFVEADQKYPKALRELVIRKGDEPLPVDDEMAAALKQFARYHYNLTIKQTPNTEGSP
ncbi:MAG: FHA domain-containing protein [Phycisphaerae bacterium]